MVDFQPPITVTVPATSANLGPGYDCLGVALSLRNRVQFRRAGSILEQPQRAEPEIPPLINLTMRGTDCEKLPTGRSNLIVTAAELLFRKVGRWPERIGIVLDSAIPVGSGLGSSSSAIVAGLFGANALVDGGLDDTALLDIAVGLEGHPDNVAPAVLGGLVLGIMSSEADGHLRLLAKRLAAPPLTAVVVLPDFALLTSEARRLLPDQISRADAIHNASRLGLLLLALTRPEMSLLREAMDDRLHQPYRLPLIPGARAAIAAAYEAGASGVALSGAGPSLIAFAAQRVTEVEAAMIGAFAAAGLSSRAWTVTISQRGVEVVTG